MNDSMTARGPDDQGISLQGNRGFGHRRLRIMDLGAASQQPMIDPQLGVGIVFNGAIYNYPALRSELQQSGYVFYSDGDTEVVLKAYHAWGEDCVKRLEGMFAFAIWERDSGRTFLARDRLGIKPLYFSRDQPAASGSRPVCRPCWLAGDIDTDIDPRALNFYLSFHCRGAAGQHHHSAACRKWPPPPP